MQEENISVFNVGARGFALEIDRAMKDGAYLRGELFLKLTKETVAPGSYILDYGCGPGRMSLILARASFRVLGVDPSEAMVALAKEQNYADLSLQFCIGDEGVLTSNSFDAIVCSSVIEYVLEPDKLLHAFHDSLRRNGVVVISYSNKLSPTRIYHRFARHKNPFGAAYQHEWSWKEFRGLLNRNGFIPTSKPKFFEGPRRIEPLVRLLPLGTLGVVAARKGSPL